MNAFQYIDARDAALAIEDPQERKRAYRRVRWEREWSQLKADPARYQARLDKVAAWKRARRAGAR